MEPLLDQDTICRLDQLTLVSRRLASGQRKGERRSRRRGSSTDFADYRNYVAGDDIRFLDWKIYGRLERLFLKLFLEEEDLRVRILVDASPSMQNGTPEKFLYARRVAAALGYIGLGRSDQLTVATFGERVVPVFGPKRGRGNRRLLLESLGALAPVPGTRLLDAFRAFAAAGRGKGLVVILSDFYDFDGYEEALRQLFAADCEVLAIHVLSPEELEPPYQGDIRLADVETDSTVDISMGPSVHDAYQRTLQAFCNGLKQYVVSRGGTYLLASTAMPFDRLVLDVLRRRGVVR